MTKWYQNVSTSEKKTFLACFCSWGLDTFENQMFIFLVPTLITYFAITSSQIAILTSCTLVTTAIGGWLAGALSDRYGRIKTLQIMVAWFSILTFILAFVNNYQTLLVLRTLQGFAIGGEWAAGAVLMAETIRTQYRGKVMPLMQSAWAFGFGLSMIVIFLITNLLPLTITWRVMFALGLLPALLIIYIKIHVPEPELNISAQEKLNDRFRRTIFGIFSPSLWRITVLGGLLGFGAHGGYHAIMVWLPIYLKQERHFSMLNTSTYLIVIIIAFWCGCVTNSFLLDKVGRRFSIVFFAICCVIIIRCYLFLPLTDGQMLMLGFPLGFFASGIPSTLGTLFCELYPQQHRGAGVGFCYNFGRILAAFFPFLLGQMSAKMSLGIVIGIDVSWAYTIVVICVLLLPETNGRDLKQITLDGRIFDE